MEQIIRAVLDELESQESVLLTWGNTQGFFTQIELSNIITQVLQNFPLDAGGLTSFGIAKVMIDRGLLLRHQQNGVSVFRTRMAEAVRLYSQLRQMFPKALIITGVPHRRWCPTIASYAANANTRSVTSRLLKFCSNLMK